MAQVGPVLGAGEPLGTKVEGRWRRYARFLVQKCPFPGAGGPHSWRRYTTFLAQVGFLVGNLRRKTGSYALQWRRSPPFFLTCANIPLHLRQHTPIPAPRSTGTCAKKPKSRSTCATS